MKFLPDGTNSINYPMSIIANFLFSITSAFKRLLELDYWSFLIFPQIFDGLNGCYHSLVHTDRVPAQFFFYYLKLCKCVKHIFVTCQL